MKPLKFPVETPTESKALFEIRFNILGALLKQQIRLLTVGEEADRIWRSYSHDGRYLPDEDFDVLTSVNEITNELFLLTAPNHNQFGLLINDVLISCEYFVMRGSSGADFLRITLPSEPSLSKSDLLECYDNLYCSLHSAHQDTVVYGPSPAWWQSLIQRVFRHRGN